MGAIAIFEGENYEHVEAVLLPAFPREKFVNFVLEGPYLYQGGRVYEGNYFVLRKVWRNSTVESKKYLFSGVVPNGAE